MVSNESIEMYLETIYILEQANGMVRAVDIAEKMGYSKPTISEWMNKLRREGYIDPEAGRKIVLTEKGRGIAAKIYERHVVISDLFVSLGISPETADEDACRVEHYISDETFDALKRHHAQHAGKEMLQQTG